MNRKKLLTAALFLLATFSIIIFYASQKGWEPLWEAISGNQPNSQVELDSLEVIIPEVKEPKMLYGFAIDSLEIMEGKIQRNQNLSEILSEFNVSFDKIHTLSLAAKEVFDVRKIASNKKYTIIHDKDSLRSALALIYEPNPTEFVVYKLKDSIQVYKGTKEVEIKEREVSGIINYSLYQTLLDNGSSPALVSALVDIYAWQIDFFRVQKGDAFKLIYEEKYVEDEMVGIGKVKAAEFTHFGKPFYAIHFDQGEGLDYFDEEGNSLRKAFLKAPLNYTRISSRYNPKRFHPVLKQYRAHLGTDYAAPTGTPIHTVGDGVVIEAKYTNNNGNYVKIRHNSTYTTQYLHMSKIATGIRPGATVRQGQTIGFVGSTGLATGPHLCFRFWKNGQQVDALKVEIPPSEPIKEAYAEDYIKVKDQWLSRLAELDQPEEKPQELLVEGPGSSAKGG